MPTPRQLVLATLKDLAQQCLTEQASLSMLISARRTLINQEKAARAKIRGLKNRIDRELAVSGKMLGVKLDELDGEND